VKAVRFGLEPIEPCLGRREASGFEKTAPRCWRNRGNHAQKLLSSTGSTCVLSLHHRACCTVGLGTQHQTKVSEREATEHELAVHDSPVWNFPISAIRSCVTPSSASRRSAGAIPARQRKDAPDSEREANSTEIRGAPLRPARQDQKITYLRSAQAPVRVSRFPSVSIDLPAGRHGLESQMLCASSLENGGARRRSDLRGMQMDLTNAPGAGRESPRCGMDASARTTNCIDSGAVSGADGLPRDTVAIQPVATAAVRRSDSHCN